jgi:double-stranded uracil-DNA glycosylase
MKRRPTRQELLSAEGRTVPDVIAHYLKVLFCGINPGLYSGAVGHHFARPGNRFWPALHLGGFTPRQFVPDEEQKLLRLGLGITNIVERATAGAAELSTAELVAGGKVLEEKVLTNNPVCLAILGVSAYRASFNRPKASLGRQYETIGETVLWVLPNPSGLNAHYNLESLGKLFAELRQEILG